MKDPKSYAAPMLFGLATLLNVNAANAQVDREKLIQAASITSKASLKDGHLKPNSLDVVPQVSATANTDLHDELAPADIDNNFVVSDHGAAHQRDTKANRGAKTETWNISLLDKNISSSAERSGKLKEAMRELKDLLKLPEYPNVRAVSVQKSSVQYLAPKKRVPDEAQSPLVMANEKSVSGPALPLFEQKRIRKDKLKAAAQQFEDLFN